MLSVHQVASALVLDLGADPKPPGLDPCSWQQVVGGRL